MPLVPSPEKPSLANRTRRIVGWGFVTLIILGIGGCVAENYRGHFLWKKYCAAWEARGERFDLAAFIPKPVPPDQNFAATPFFGPFLDYTIDESDQQHPNHWKDEQALEQNRALVATLTGLRSKNKKLPDIGHWQIGTFTDLGLWQDCFRGNTNFPFAATTKDPASDVLTALRRYDQLLDELRAASARPHSVFPVHYDEHHYALLPHLAPLKGLARIVHLRAAARLEAGHSAEALQDAQLCLRLADSLKSDGFLISQLTRISIAEIGVQSVWEGLARQRWREAQLTEIQSALARLNILEDYGRAMRTERAVAIHFIDLLRTGEYRDLSPSRDSASDEIGPTDYSRVRYLPGGIFRQNQLAVARLYQQRLIPLVDLEKHRVDVQSANACEDVPELRRFHPYRIFASLLAIATSRSVERFARGQAAIDLAVVACALERHRLSAGRYPDTLDALRPEFLAKLPPDLITGQPLKYRLTENGGFLLYSVGWNESDDGGNVVLTARKQAFDAKRGDWVWSYSPPPGADEKTRQ